MNLEMYHSTYATCTQSIAVYPAVPILAALSAVKTEGKGIAHSDL